jgi:hypothetical protein
LALQAARAKGRANRHRQGNLIKTVPFAAHFVHPRANFNILVSVQIRAPALMGFYRAASFVASLVITSLSNCSRCFSRPANGVLSVFWKFRQSGAARVRHPWMVTVETAQSDPAWLRRGKYPPNSDP